MFSHLAAEPATTCFGGWNRPAAQASFSSRHRVCLPLPWQVLYWNPEFQLFKTTLPIKIPMQKTGM
jgi:hypothetical protein